MDCTFRVAKTKALISFVVTAKLICGFVFAYANCWFSHAQAHITFIKERMYLLIITRVFNAFSANDFKNAGAKMI